MEQNQPPIRISHIQQGDQKDESLSEPLLGQVTTKKNSFLQKILSNNKIEGSFWRKFLILTIKEIPRKKGQFILGFISCLLVVLVVCLLMTTIANAPVAFLKIAEIDAAERDVVISADQFDQHTSLNFTEISQLLQYNPDYSYSTPRIEAQTIVYSSKFCVANLNPNDLNWRYNQSIITKTDCQYKSSICVQEACSSEQQFRGDLFLIDQTREVNMGLGREYILANMPRLTKGRAHISTILAKNLQVNPGDIIYLSFNASDILAGLWTESFQLLLQSNWKPEYQNLENVLLPITIDSLMSNPLGKYGVEVQDGILMEYSLFLSLLIENLDPLIPIETKDFLSSSNLYEYGQEIIWNVPPDQRLAKYIDYDYANIIHNLVSFGTDIMYIIGFPTIQPNLPIGQSLRVTRFVSLFLGLALNTVIFILLLLAVLLIYSLLTISVEEKAFETGVLRSLGISNFRLIYALSLQAFAFAIPSWIFGVIMSQILMLIVVTVFKNLTAVELSPLLTIGSVFTSAILIIVVPIASSIFPIRDVLGQSLNEALERRRSKTAAYKIDVERSSSANHISWPVLITGFASAFFWIFCLLSFSIFTFS